jgi:hypothetical protein
MKGHEKSLVESLEHVPAGLIKMIAINLHRSLVSVSRSFETFCNAWVTWRMERPEYVLTEGVGVPRMRKPASACRNSAVGTGEPLPDGSLAGLDYGQFQDEEILDTFNNRKRKSAASGAARRGGGRGGGAASGAGGGAGGGRGRGGRVEGAGGGGER